MIESIQDTPVTVDLLVQGNSRGWTVEGGDAIHEKCNTGKISKLNYPIVAGLQYEFSYTIQYINTGSLTASLGGVNSASRTAPGFYTETITAINTNPLEFLSDANCRIGPVTIRVITQVYNLKDRSTIVWNEKDNKWTDYRHYNPDCGFSMFANFFMNKNGRTWVSSTEATRNNYFGVQYYSIFKFAANMNQTQPKTFEAISYKANKLMVTTDDGIQTSLGQLSDLVQEDFLKGTLADGVNEVKIYDVEGIYSAGFMKAKPDVINGDVLKGNWITIELIEVSTGVLKLTNVTVHSERSAIGAR